MSLRSCALSSIVTSLLLLALVGFLSAQATDKPAADTPPAPAAESKPGETPAVPPMLKENTRLIDRTGRILSLSADLGVGTIPRSVFQPSGELGYYILLENKLLEKVEAQTRHGERDVKISGTVSEYRGQNFLLLTRVYVSQK